MGKSTNYLRSLKGHIRQRRREWAASNPSRLKYEASALRRLFEHACDAPVLWCVNGFALAATFSILVWVWQPPYRGIINFLPLQEGYELQAGFLGLWTVQSALAAVVFPIVVAFITVLLQRQNASKASLQAYFSSSAAKLTGLSSLGLVFLMGLQFALLGLVPSMVAFAWMVADAIWFSFNVLLTAYFLVTTFEFASPEGRVRARFGYMLRRGWPDEWAFHLAREVSRNPIGAGLMNVKDALESLSDPLPGFSGPEVSLGQRDGLRLSFRGSRSISNFRYGLIETVFKSWARRSSKTRAAVEAGRSQPIERLGPVLEMPHAYGDEFTHQDAVVRLSGGDSLRWWEKGLLRLSLSFSLSSVAPRLTVLDALEEVRAEGAFAIANDAETDFQRIVSNLVDVYDAVVEASGFYKSGKYENWSLHLDTSEESNGARLVESWQQVFVDLHASALAAVVKRKEYALETIRTPAVLLLREASYLNSDLREQYVLQQYRLLRALLDWAADGFTGARYSPPSLGALMPEPLDGRYVDLLKAGVGAWESMKNYRLGFSRHEERMTQTQLKEFLSPFARHLEFSAQLVMDALVAGDQRGYQYFADSLLRWTGQTRTYTYVDSVPWADRFRVTVLDLTVNPDDFRRKFGPPRKDEDDSEVLRDLWQLAFENLWQDAILTLAATALNRSLHGRPSPPMVAHLISHAIDGQPMGIDSASEPEGRAFESADALFGAMVRQVVEGGLGNEGYLGFIDKLAGRLGPNPTAEGIAGRTYMRAGNWIGKLYEAHLVLLSRMVPEGWKPSSVSAQMLRSGADDALQRRLEEVVDSWISLLSSTLLVSKYKDILSLMPSTSGQTIVEGVRTAREGLEDLLKRVRDFRRSRLSSASVAKSAVERLAKHSERAIAEVGTKTGHTPLLFFKEVVPTLMDASDTSWGPVRSLRISGYDKGLFTEPLMAVIASNEPEAIGELLANVMAVQVVRDLLAADRVETRTADTKQKFLEAVTDFSEGVVAQGGYPMLFLASKVAPQWLRELTRFHPDDRTESPTMRRHETYLESDQYVGHLRGAAVFIGPVTRGRCLLCTREEFGSLFLGVDSSGQFRVQVSPHDEGLNCDVTFSWQQRMEGRGGKLLELVLDPLGSKNLSVGL